MYTIHRNRIHGARITLEWSIPPQYIIPIVNHFDNAAADWDKNTDHLRRARVIAGEIIKSIPLSKNWSALEFGSGTGLLSFILKPRLGNITLIDNSTEMIKMTQRKLLETKTRGITALKLNLLSDKHRATYNLIYTLMSLHHIIDIPKILGILFSLLTPGGYICVADLLQEDGSFHSQVPGFKGHHGFNPERLKERFTAAGFTGTTYKTVYTIERKSDHKDKGYPLFLMTGKKREQES